MMICGTLRIDYAFCSMPPFGIFLLADAVFIIFTCTLSAPEEVKQHKTWQVLGLCEWMVVSPIICKLQDDDCVP